jgi:hypothetical protein
MWRSIMPGHKNSVFLSWTIVARPAAVVAADEDDAFATTEADDDDSTGAPRYVIIPTSLT